MNVEELDAVKEILTLGLQGYGGYASDERKLEKQAIAILQPLLKQAELLARKSELNKLPHSGTHDNGMFEYYEISKRYIDERLATLEAEMEKK